MLPFPGFAGPSYQAFSPFAANERTMNLYPEVITPTGNPARAVLYGTPGLSLWADLLSGPVRALFEQDGRAFAVAGDGFFELFGPALFIRHGSVQIDTSPATIASNGRNGFQLFIVSGGLGYTFTLRTNVLALITDVDFLPATTAANAIMGAHLDGYFLVLLRDGTVQNSVLNNGTSWLGGDVGTRSQASDTFVAMLVDPPHLWLWGEKSGEIWYNNQSPDFPLGPAPQGFLQEGIAAPFSAAVFAGGVAWLSANRDGARVVLHGAGGPTRRLSTHGVEGAFQSYARVDDAIAWTYQEQGHQFYVLTFPTAQATWVFDATVPQLFGWHERGYWSGSGTYNAHLGRCHSMAYGAHLVGSRVDGKIYRMDLGLYDDAGVQIRRLRRPPPIIVGQRRLFYERVQLVAEVGEGPATVILKWSDDGGKTWSNDHEASTGPVGAYAQRIQWKRLGSGRRRVWDFITTDPAKVAWPDALIKYSIGRS